MGHKQAHMHVRCATCEPKPASDKQATRRLPAQPRALQRVHLAEVSYNLDRPIRQLQMREDQEAHSIQLLFAGRAAEELDLCPRVETRVGLLLLDAEAGRGMGAHPDLNHVVLREQLDASGPALFRVVAHEDVSGKDKDEGLTRLAHALADAADGVDEGGAALAVSRECHEEH